jgi:Transposase and inactivated derivatives
MANSYTMKILFKITNVKKSSYYKWLRASNTRLMREEENEKIIEEIRQVQTKNKGRYGIGPITHELKKYNHKKIYRLMKENGLLSVIKRRKKYVKPGTPHPKNNVLKRNFETSCPYDKLVTDVTEIKMFGRKLYISIVKDLHTKVIESVEVGESASLMMAIKTIEKIKNNSIQEGTIFHSDQGSLYNSLKFQLILEENNFILSMSRKGTPIDNSPAESFFSILKSELIYNPYVIIISFEDLIQKVLEYIEYYNNERIQKGLGYLTPIKFKEKCLKKPLRVGVA